VTKGDLIVERSADRLERLAAKASSSGGVTAKLAAPLAEDAEFLRKLKPSLIAARARGELPTNERPGEPPAAPSAPQLGRRAQPRKTGGGPSPWLVVAAALAAGVLLARWIDWRGHAHPRE
jgi:hypothetical protein